jgi:hypothetical protein
VKTAKNMPWRHGAVVIASASGTENPGSNPVRVLGFKENVAMLML